MDDAVVLVTNSDQQTFDIDVNLGKSQFSLRFGHPQPGGAMDFLRK